VRARMRLTLDVRSESTAGSEGQWLPVKLCRVNDLLEPLDGMPKLFWTTAEPEEEQEFGSLVCVRSLLV